MAFPAPVSTKHFLKCPTPLSSHLLYWFSIKPENKCQKFIYLLQANTIFSVEFVLHQQQSLASLVFTSTVPKFMKRVKNLEISGNILFTLT